MIVSKYREFILENKSIVFPTPSEACEWRVRTLLTKEPLTIKWLNSFDSNEVVWDIGANIGIYTLYAAIIKQCNVFAFEPQHTNFYLLNDAILKNKVDHMVKAYCVALGNVTKITKLNQGNQEPGSSAHIITKRNRITFAQGCVELTIDKLVEMGVPQPSRVKLDVDGIELQIIQGGSNTLPKVHSILTEIDRNNNKHLPLIEAIESLGFFYNPQDVRLQETGIHAGFGEILFYNKRFVQPLT